MREKAVEMADRMLQSGDCKWKDTVLLIRADLLRRAGRFDELLEQYEGVAFDRGIMRNILAFEKELARRKLSGCYTAADAEEYAAGNYEWAKDEGSVIALFF